MADSLSWLDDEPAAPARTAADALDWLDAPRVPTDVGPAARAARAGGSMPQRPVPSDVDLGIESPPARAPFGWGPARPQNPVAEANNPLAEDWIGQSVVGGVLGAGAGEVLAPAAEALGASPAVANVIGQAAAGGTSSAVQGGDFATGALLGAVPAAAGAWFRGAAERASERLFQQYGKAATEPGRLKLRQIGPEQVHETATKYGVDRGSARAAEVAADKGIKIAGGKIGDALGVIKDTAGDIDMRSVAGALDDLQKQFGSRAATRDYAGKVAELRSTLLQRYGEAGTISPTDLHGEISAIEGSAYGGNYANPSIAKKLQRRTAGVLNEVLDDHVSEAAKKNPLAAEAAKSLEHATADYRVLKTLQPIIAKQATAETFRKSIAERFAEAPVKTALTGLAAAAKAPGELADVYIARMMAARNSGGVPPELAEQALRAGVRADLVASLTAPRNGHKAPTIGGTAKDVAGRAYRAVGPMLVGRHRLIPELGGEGGGEE